MIVSSQISWYDSAILFCSIPGSRESEPILNFIKSAHKCSLASSVHFIRQTWQHSRYRGQSQMKSPHARIRFASVVLFAILAMNFMAGQNLRPGAGGDTSPDGHVPGQAPTKQPAVVQGNGINYHGGPVLKGNPVPIHIIWYGNWANGAKPSDSAVTVSLIEAFLASNALGGSSYEAINTTYGD